MNILILPCHSILEYDEFRLFHEMGHNVYSPGSYFKPREPQDPKRPAIDIDHNEELCVSVCKKPFNRETGFHVNDTLIEWADIIVSHHIPDFISNNWDRMKHKKVIWRTIGQCLKHTENEMERYRNDGLYIVRYSKMEEYIIDYIGCDEIIYFYKDENEFKDWNGNEDSVMLVGQNMVNRGEHLQFDLLDRVSKPFSRKIFGPKNENIPGWSGNLDYDSLKREIRNTRCLLYAGTKPASYTLSFMESMMTGQPIVSIGKNLFDHNVYPECIHLFEIPNIIKNGINGFYSDNESYLRDYINILINDYDLAKKISIEARKTAIDYFGKQKAMNKWNKFFKRIGE